MRYFNQVTGIVAVIWLLVTMPHLGKSSSIGTGVIPPGVALLNAVNSFTMLQKFASGYSIDQAFTDFEISGCPSGCTNAALTQTQITNLNTSPVTLIAAQGAGTVIVPEGFVFELVVGGTAYASGATPSVRYNGTTGTVVGTFTSATSITSATNEYTSFGVAAITGVATNTVNLPVTLQAASNFTCTATCGTLSYWIKYHVLAGF